MSEHLFFNKQYGKRTKTFFAAVVLYLYYYSYRYVLKVNSTGTSPTYGDTPFFLQFAKYAILLFLVCALFLFSLKRAIKCQPFTAGLLSLVIVLSNVYAFVFTKDSENVIGALCFMPALILFVTGGADERNVVSAFSDVLVIYLNYFIIYEGIQIAAFALFGRLPALAYATGKISEVRFGGALDDPNGFAVLLCFFIPFACVRYKGLTRAGYVFILLAFLILTWSMTGIALFVGLSFAWFTIKIFLNRSRKSVAFFLAVAAGGCFALAAMLASSSFRHFLEVKSDSIWGHLEGWDMSGLSVFTWLGIKPVDLGGEIGIIRAIGYGGIIYLAAFTAFFAISFIAAERRKKQSVSREEHAVWSGTVFYIAAVYISCFNLPMNYNFAVFGFLVALCALALCKRRSVLFEKRNFVGGMTYGRD